MNSYRSYMDSLELSPQRHDELMQNLSLVSADRGWKRTLRRAVPLAACLALVAAAAVMWPRMSFERPAPAENVFTPIGEPGGEIAEWPTIEKVDFADGSRTEEVLADIALPDGYFFADMTQEQMARMLGSGETLSGLLGWENYEVTGQITYGGDGSVFWVNLMGEGPEGTGFTMQLSPGRLPPVCIIKIGRAHV